MTYSNVMITRKAPPPPISIHEMQSQRTSETQYNTVGAVHYHRIVCTRSKMCHSPIIESSMLPTENHPLGITAIFKRNIGRGMGWSHRHGDRTKKTVCLLKTIVHLQLLALTSTVTQ